MTMLITKPAEVTVRQSTVGKMTKVLEEAWARDKQFDKPTLKDRRLKKTIRIDGAFPKEDRREVCEAYQSAGWGHVVHRERNNNGKPYTVFVFFKDPL